MTALAPPVLELGRQAAEWRLLALLFEPPAGDWRCRVAALAAEVDDPELKQAAGAALTEAGEDFYHSTFGPGGPASPREATYFDNVQLGSLISELAAHYEAFAYSPNLVEPPDHIAVEAGFLAYLHLKQAYALSEQNPEAAALVAEAATRFRETHLHRFAPPLQRLFQDSGIQYLTHAAAALTRLCGPVRLPESPLPILQDPAPDSWECA